MAKIQIWRDIGSNNYNPCKFNLLPRYYFFFFKVKKKYAKLERAKKLIKNSKTKKN